MLEFTIIYIENIFSQMTYSIYGAISEMKISGHFIILRPFWVLFLQGLDLLELCEGGKGKGDCWQIEAGKLPPSCSIIYIQAHGAGRVARAGGGGGGGGEKGKGGRKIDQVQAALGWKYTLATFTGGNCTFLRNTGVQQHIVVHTSQKRYLLWTELFSFYKKLYTFFSCACFGPRRNSRVGILNKIRILLFFVWVDWSWLIHTGCMFGLASC